MQFLYPQNAWYLAAVGLFAVMALVAVFRFGRGQARFGNEHKRPTGRSRLGRFAFRHSLKTAAVALVAFALLGPCWGEREVPARRLPPRDVLVLLDVSRSMLTEDAVPNRLELAKRGLRQLASVVAENRFRIGLIAFADRAVLLCPPTSDIRHFLQELNDADLATVRSHRGDPSAVDGTQIGLALQRAVRALSPSQAEQDRRDVAACLLVVSDGGDELDETATKALRQLKRLDVPVFSIGVGDVRRTSPIPLSSPRGRREFLRYRGEIVQTRLDETPLRQIAAAGLGQYWRASDRAMPVNELMTAVASRIQPADSNGEEAKAVVPIVRFEWFVVPAILLLVIESLIASCSRRKAQESPGRSVTGWLSKVAPQPKKTTWPGRPVIGQKAAIGRAEQYSLSR